MPGYKTHLAGAAVVTAGAIYGAQELGYYTWRTPESLGIVAAALLASLFPDTDTASKGRPFFYGLLALTDVALLITEQYRWAALLGFFAMLPVVGNHRGWTHTWWAALIVPLPLALIPHLLFQQPWEPLLPCYLAAVLGYFSHLLLDREW